MPVLVLASPCIGLATRYARRCARWLASPPAIAANAEEPGCIGRAILFSMAGMHVQHRLSSQKSQSVP